MTDLIIDIPDDTGIGSGHGESVVETLQIQPETQHQVSTQVAPPESDVSPANTSKANTPSEGTTAVDPDKEDPSNETATPEPSPKSRKSHFPTCGHFFRIPALH